MYIHLNNHAPLKTKFLGAIHANFVLKELAKVFILRTKVRTKYLPKKSEEARLLCEKIINACVLGPASVRFCKIDVVTNNWLVVWLVGW